MIGTMGEAPEAIVLVESPEDVRRCRWPTRRKLAYLTQTTLRVDDANRIIARLKERFPQIAAPPKEDICYATQNRQEAVRLLAGEADVVLVLGSQNSSNSQRLAELARETRRAGLSDRRPGRHRPGVVRRARRRCWSPPAPARRKRSSSNASTGSATDSARRSSRARSAKRTSPSRCRAKLRSIAAAK